MPRQTKAVGIVSLAASGNHGGVVSYGGMVNTVNVFGLPKVDQRHFNSTSRPVGKTHTYVPCVNYFGGEIEHKNDAVSFFENGKCGSNTAAT